MIEKINQLERNLRKLPKERIKLAASWWELPFYSRLPFLVNKYMLTIILLCRIICMILFRNHSFTSPEHSPSTKDTSAASSPEKKNEAEN